MPSKLAMHDATCHIVNFVSVSSHRRHDCPNDFPKVNSQQYSPKGLMSIGGEVGLRC